MSIPRTVLIGDYLTFSITTHNPENGNLSNATSVLFTVFNCIDEVVASGSMDQVGTVTGLYKKLLLCETGTFIDGEIYTLMITANVNGYVGGLSSEFTAYEKISTSLGCPIIIQGFDSISGRNVQIIGRYK